MYETSPRSKAFLTFLPYSYWNGEFEQFHNPKNGIDIDGSWLDMNEPTNVCHRCG